MVEREDWSDASWGECCGKMIIKRGQWWRNQTKALSQTVEKKKKYYKHSYDLNRYVIMEWLVRQFITQLQRPQFDSGRRRWMYLVFSVSPTLPLCLFTAIHQNKALSANVKYAGSLDHFLFLVGVKLRLRYKHLRFGKVELQLHTTTTNNPACHILITAPIRVVRRSGTLECRSTGFHKRSKLLVLKPCTKKVLMLKRVLMFRGLLVYAVKLKSLTLCSPASFSLFLPTLCALIN